MVDEVADDVDLVVRGAARQMSAFRRLRLLHQTTQQVARELESFSRRMELAIRRAHRRPDLLTPKRFDRIVQQSVAKLEQLKQLPLQALRGIESNRP
jgi:ATP-dependent Zn protease